MRLLLVVQDAILPQRLVQDALARLIDRGHDVFLCILGSPGPLLDVAASLGVECTALASASPTMTPRGASRVRRIITRWQPDLVHAHEPLPAIAAGLGATRRDVPILYHRHHLSGSVRLRAASWTATRVTDGTLAVSGAVATKARDEDHRPAARVVVARNGLEPLRAVGDDEVVALRAELGLGDGPVHVAVARLRHEKGIDLLLDALPHLMHDGRLVIVGSGPEEAVLRARASSAVHLVGHRDDVAPWYALADVVVAPSRTEGLPLAAIEAMACGRPLVAAAVGGLVELVDDGVTGLLVPAGDAVALAGAIDALAADPARRAVMGSAARARYAAGFSADAMVRGWEQGYETLRRR